MNIDSHQAFVMEFPKLQHPFKMVLAGPTGCGKTYFVLDLLHYKREMFFPVPNKIAWFYGIHQPLYDNIPEVTFVEGLPLKFQEYLGKHTIFIIDDLMSHSANQKLLTDLFTKEEYNLPWKPPEEPAPLNNIEVEPMLPRKEDSYDHVVLNSVPQGMKNEASMN
ncbi:hypothetical protein AVEN_229385-1 [Araneus ventricosus]|uniref:Uncharacterized protein n=1 Tax=Araneus ventricosus TaxID=182803 RepID=A0A4Y2U2V5_ARAVE|nr:hypothetical protein AVEN_229385-1 [Araneus ventricosus]